MRSVRFVSLFAILISMLVLAQSSRAPLGNQLNGLPIAQQPQHRMPTLSQVPQGTPFTQGGSRAFMATQNRGRPLPMNELSFAPVVVYASGGLGADSVAVADVNGDGKPDLIVANCASSQSTGCSGSTGGIGVVSVLLGNGDGTFQTAVPYASGGYFADSVAIADVNGDGKPDLLVANECETISCASGGVGVLLGNGDGTFQTAASYGSAGYEAASVAVADVNGDGKPDVVLTNLFANNSNSNGSVGVLLGNGDGTFQTAVPYGSGGYEPYSVVIADVNGDGKPDLLVENFSVGQYQGLGLVGVLLGNGDGTFQTAVTYSTGGYYGSAVAVADVNGDGKPDLVAANECNASNCYTGTLGVLLGNGDGTFQTAVTYNSDGYLADSVAIADVNGDGKLDLVVANQCGNYSDCQTQNGVVSVLLGNGDGTFQDGVSYFSGGYYASSVALADVNADGKPDLLVASDFASSSYTTYGTVGVLMNTSLGTTQTSLASALNPSIYGRAVTFTASVTSQFFEFQPTGTVSFYDGATNIGNSDLSSSGVATLTTSALAVGGHSITATYNGNTNFAPSTSPVLYQIVVGSYLSEGP